MPRSMWLRQDPWFRSPGRLTMKITKLLAIPTAIALALLAAAAVGHAQTSVPVGRVPNEKFSDVRSVIGDAIAG